MDLDAFRASLGNPDPPPGLAPALRALWHAGRDDWRRAHQIAQVNETPDANWVHAHLHRVEGDLSNADYWYARAGRARPDGDMDGEWREIATALLGGA